VLGFSAKETASMHDKTVASINSALQRARTLVNERVPEQDELAAHAVYDQGVREVVRRYADSVERGDIEAVVRMLGEEVA
jgi:RNA polymerase sigma-70 factor (ECF subfamily)